MSESNQPSSSSSASQKAERTSDKNIPREPQHNYDPELDIRNEHFNPLKALYAPSAHMPTENVPLYNNLAHFESSMKMRQQRQASGDSSQVSNSKETAEEFVMCSSKKEAELHCLFSFGFIFCVFSTHHSYFVCSQREQRQKCPQNSFGIRLNYISDDFYRIKVCVSTI